MSFIEFSLIWWKSNLWQTTFIHANEMQFCGWGHQKMIICCVLLLFRSWQWDHFRWNKHCVSEFLLIDAYKKKNAFTIVISVSYRSARYCEPEESITLSPIYSCCYVCLYLLCLQDVFRGLNTRLVPSFDCQMALYIWDDLWYSTSIFLQRHKTHSISIEFLQTPCAAYAVFYGQTRGRRVHRANIYLSFPCALVACKPAKAAIQRSTADSWGGVMRSNNVLSRVP